MILNLEEGSGKSLYERIYEYIKKEIQRKYPLQGTAALHKTVGQPIRCKPEHGTDGI